MSAALIAICTVPGAAVGVVTPRVAYRLSVEFAAPPRPGCADCGRPFPAGLAGWVQAVGRCPQCGARLGPPAWLTVPTGAAAFGLLGWAFGADPVLPGFLAVAGFGLVLAFVDIGCLRLPDPLVAAAFVAGGAPVVLVAALDGTWPALGRAALAALACFAAYLVLALVPGANLGFGDVKLAGVLGFMLGWLGWPAVVLGLVLPHLVNGPVALALLLTRRVGRRGHLPLGPALLGGALLAVVIAAGPP